MADATSPTADDFGRDLLADMALCEAATPGPWRNTIRRETAAQVAQAIRKNGGVGDSRCSEAVVKTARTPTVQDVICWMGPGASLPDDIVDARFIAAARTGWPAALRLALHCRALLARCLPCLDALRAAGRLALEPEEGEDPEELGRLLAEAELLVREMKEVQGG